MLVVLMGARKSTNNCNLYALEHNLSHQRLGFRTSKWGRGRDNRFTTSATISLTNSDWYSQNEERVTAKSAPHHTRRSNQQL